MSARDAVLASTDLVDELMSWGLGAWDRHRPSYEFTCPEKTVAVPLNRLLHVLLDERPWADSLNECDVADAVRCWLRGVLRSIATRRRVCKAWAAAGQRCFETLVGELRNRGAAHARAARAFLRAEPESYPGQLPPDLFSRPVLERTNLVRPWSKDDEGAKHVSLLQALFEYPFRHIGMPVTPYKELTERDADAHFSFFAKHSIWPRSWVSELAGLMMPINERQLWDTLHRRCRCCPRSSRCCVQKDRTQMLLRSGGDGYGTAFGEYDNHELGPWPETDIGGNYRVGRSVLAAYGATVTMSMTAVCEPICERPDGSPCMLCNLCEETILPYTSKLDTVSVLLEDTKKAIDIRILTEGHPTSNQLLMAMFFRGLPRNSPADAKLSHLFKQRMQALSAAPGARTHCKCKRANDNPNNIMCVTLTLFEAEQGSNHSWASFFGLTRAQFEQEAVQWRRLKDASMKSIVEWSKMELRRRVCLLNETLPGRYGDHSIMIRDDQDAFYHKFYKHNHVICTKTLANDEHLYMYAPLRRLFQMLQGSMDCSPDDVENAKVFSTMATTQYEETFGTDEAMIDYFQTVESLIGAAWGHTESTDEGHVLKIDDRHHALRRIAQAYIDANSDSPPLTDVDKMKAFASIPAMAPTHPQLLLRWFLAAICRSNKYHRDASLEVKNVTWMPSTTRSGPPPEKLACQDVVVNLSFSAPGSIDPIEHDWPRHMRFAFALRMHHLCDLSTTMANKENRVQESELGLKAWLDYANAQAYGLSRMCTLDESNLTLLLLFERILQLPWVPVFFPLRSTDPAEGTCGIGALGSVCNRGSWYGDVYPICINGNSVCKERGLDCCQCCRECNF